MPPPQTEQLRFHILSDDLEEADKALLKGIAAGREGAQVCFYEPARLLSEEALAKIDGTLENRANLARAAYYRILAADLLPQDARRALYIDGDVVCTGGLEELFGLDLRGCPAAMCLDTSTSSIATYNRLGYPPQDGYFNSGVILFDLDLWRREGLAQAMLGCLERNAKRLMAHDQDLINACLHGRILPLDYSYNLQPQAFNVFHWIKEEENGYLAIQSQYLPKDEWPALRAAVESPRLVHFSWRRKPWRRECDIPFTPVWRYFYAASPWAKEPLKRSPATARIRRLCHRLAEKLSLAAPEIPYPEEAYKAARRVLDSVTQYSK